MELGCRTSLLCRCFSQELQLCPAPSQTSSSAPLFPQSAAAAAPLQPHFPCTPLNGFTPNILSLNRSFVDATWTEPIEMLQRAAPKDGIRVECGVWALNPWLSGRGMLGGLGLCCSLGAGRKWECCPHLQAFIPMGLGLHLFLASLWDADVPGVEGGSWQEC